MNKDNEQREISRKKPFTVPSNTPEYRDGFDLSWLQWIIVLIGFYLILNRILMNIDPKSETL